MPEENLDESDGMGARDVPKGVPEGRRNQRHDKNIWNAR